MNRRPVEITDAPERHYIAPLEFRDNDEDENVVTLSGYASTYEPYEMYGGPAKGGWIEQIARGAFDKTMKERPDLHLLINHAGMPLARTKSGTLKLTVDDHGLRVDAQLDRRDPDVQALEVKMRRGDMDEMSFAFRVKAQEWEATADFPDDDMALRTITEVSLHKGDVSVVNFGANPTTSASVRSVEEALELLANCDAKELVEARCDDSVLRQAKERLSAVQVLESVEGPTGTLLDGVLDGAADAVRELGEAVGKVAEKDFVVELRCEDRERPLLVQVVREFDENGCVVNLKKSDVIFCARALQQMEADYRESDPAGMRRFDVREAEYRRRREVDPESKTVCYPTDEEVDALVAAEDRAAAGAYADRLRLARALVEA